FEPCASLFNGGKEKWVFEGGAPGGHDRAHTVPDHPDLSIAFEKKFVVNHATVDDTGDHIPVAYDHADIRVFLAALRIPLHQLFRSGRVKMLDEPSARFAQPRFPAEIVEPQHEVHFVIGDLSHERFSLYFTRSEPAAGNPEKKQGAPTRRAGHCTGDALPLELQ